MRKQLKVAIAISLMAVVLPLILPTVQAAYVIVDDDFKQGWAMKVSVTLYKDTSEQSEDWDFYSVKVKIQDTRFALNPTCKPFKLYVYVKVTPGSYFSPIEFEPEEGLHLTQAITSFSYMGISLPIFIPSGVTDCTWTEGSYWRWDILGNFLPYYIPGSGAFDSISEYSIGFKVPVPETEYVSAYATVYVEWWLNGGGILWLPCGITDKLTRITVEE